MEHFGHHNFTINGLDFFSYRNFLAKRGWGEGWLCRVWGVYLRMIGGNLYKQRLLLFLLLIALGQCRIPSVELVTTIDPDIVLINIEDGDRAFIGKLIKTIDSCKPAVIAIDAIFLVEKDELQDSLLADALKIAQHDVLVYYVDENGKLRKNRERFAALAAASGFLHFEKDVGLVSNMTPLPKINGEVHQSFPLTIVNQWKPGFKHDIKTNKSIPIIYRRTLQQYTFFSGSGFNVSEYGEYLVNKVVLLGYLGPSDEDKNFTPLRLVKDYPEDKPDTYNLVIVANAVRTLIEHEVRE